VGEEAGGVAGDWRKGVGLNAGVYVGRFGRGRGMVACAMVLRLMFVGRNFVILLFWRRGKGFEFFLLDDAGEGARVEGHASWASFGGRSGCYWERNWCSIWWLGFFYRGLGDGTEGFGYRV